MPVYTIEQLIALKGSDLIVVPEFEWNEIEKVPAGSNYAHEQGHSWRRGSHNNEKRPVVMPKAAIPFSQRALFDKKADKESSSAAQTEEADEGEADDDEYAARFLLKNKAATKKTPETTSDGAPVVNLSYAAALAASMKMSEASEEPPKQGEEEAAAAAEDDDGWVSVSHQAKPRRNRNKGSFSKWRV